jgi:tRNA G18 (ribose-2'-O)-methylase SpoU
MDSTSFITIALDYEESKDVFLQEMGKKIRDKITILEETEDPGNLGAEI